MGGGSYGGRLTIRSVLWHKAYIKQLSRSSSSSFPPPLLFTTLSSNHSTKTHQNPSIFLLTPNNPLSCYPQHRLFPHFTPFSSIPTSSITSIRNLSTIADGNVEQKSSDGTDEDVEPIDSWEEEDDTEPEIGDGADGGGIALQNCPWGERALSVAREVLLEFNDDIKLYAFKTSPRGYIYMRLDKLSHEYGCPSMEEIESYSRQYKKRLDDVGESGQIPDDLALEVSSPSAERLLRVPEDLHRFKDMPMKVSYVDNVEGKSQEKNGVFLLDLINSDLGTCTWRLANVKENRDPLAKGRPLSRKLKDWRLELPFDLSKRVTLYLDY